MDEKNQAFWHRYHWFHRFFEHRIVILILIRLQEICFWQSLRSTVERYEQDGSELDFGLCQLDRVCFFLCNWAVLQSDILWKDTIDSCTTNKFSQNGLVLTHQVKILNCIRHHTRLDHQKSCSSCCTVPPKNTLTCGRSPPRRFCAWYHVPVSKATQKQSFYFSSLAQYNLLPLSHKQT